MVWFFVVVGGAGAFGELRLPVLIFLFFIYAAALSCTRRVISNMIGSIANRPVVKTGMIRGKAAGNSVASVSNGFSFSVSGPIIALSISCVKCRPRSCTCGKRKDIVVVLGRSLRGLSRIIIINCNITGGQSLANSITSIGKRGLRRATSFDTTRTLRKETTNIAVLSADTGPNRSIRIHIHNGHSLGTAGSPLCIISNVPVIITLDRLDPSSVRSIRILGSTSTATVCKSHNTGNIVLMAAGGKGRNGIRISCGNCMNMRRTTHGVRVFSNKR